MPDFSQPVVQELLFALLNETFEQGGNIYVAKGTGLLPTLNAVTADMASRTPFPGAQTIAAHCAHVAYYVRVNHDGMLGRAQQFDWPSSWREQQVGAPEWEDLKARVRREYDALIETLHSLETCSVQQIGDSLAIVAHTAYHLGAIRQLLRSLSIPP